MIERKTVCLATNWYPSEENPYAGLFFREQAIAEKEYLDYIVLHINRNYKSVALVYWIKKLFNKEYRFDQIKEEFNIREYSVSVSLPVFYRFADLFSDLWNKAVKRNNIPGVGKYISISHKRIKKKIITKIFQTHFNKKIDVMYCVDAQNEASTIRYAAEALNIPFILGEHGPVPWPGSVINDENKEAMEKADLFLAISQDKIRQVLLQNIRLKRIEYIGNMIDENQFSLVENNNKVKTFLIVAAHSFYKNYDMFIKVMNRLTEITDLPFKVIIAGYGANKGYSEGVDVFEHQIENSKFADKAELIPEIPHSEIQKIYARADAFIMTSIQEGQPVSAMEAACCGLPIFSTRCGGVEDYVDDSIGRIYDVTDYQSMADGLKKYLEGEYRFKSKVIRSSVVKKFGKETFVDNYVRYVNDIVYND